MDLSYADKYLDEMKRYFKKHCNSQAYTSNESKIHSVAWNCNGKYLAAGSHDNTICVLSLEKESLRKRAHYKDHNASVDQVCWSPMNPELLASASADKTVRIWDLRTNSCAHKIQTSGDNINICWSPNSQTIAVGNKNDLITFIDTNTYTVFKEEQFKVEVNEITWDNRNDRFYVTNGNGSTFVYDYPEMKLLTSLKAHTANCICIRFDPTGKYFAVGGADALVSIWDAEDWICINTLSRLDWPVRSVSFSYDGKLIASASEDSFVDVAVVESGEQVCEIPCNGPTFTIAWHPYHYLLAYAYGEKDKNDNETGNIHIFGLTGTGEAIHSI